MASDFQIRCAAHLLKQGGLIAYPTEAVYGLGCDPFDEHAVRELLALKQRAPEKGLIVVAADFNQLTPLLQPVSAKVMAPVQKSWPGPTTWVLPADPSVPAWLTGGRDSIAVRVSAHPLVRALCSAFGGPIVSTSANPGGLPPARSALKVEQYFPGQLQLILSGPLDKSAQPTAIRDARSGKLLRQP